MTRVDEALSGPVAVYGAGTFGRSAAVALREHGVDVRLLLDRSRTEVPEGFVVRAPDDPSVDRGLPVVLGLCNPGVDLAEVAAELTASGHPGVVTPVQLYQWLGARGAHRENYWLTTDREVYLDAHDDIVAARALLSDGRSRSLYDAILAYRTSGDIAALPVPDPLREQYLPADVPFVTGPVRLVDCGAYDGDTVRAFLDAGVDLTAVVALEPDPTSYDALCRELARHDRISSLALPVGASDRSEQVRFRADGTSAAAVDLAGDSVVQCVALDDVLHGWGPTHVKMDIEGAEASALHGMERTVTMSRPALAVSLYHRPADLWELILQVHALLAPVRLFVRVYAHQGFETVLYALPLPAAEASS